MSLEEKMIWAAVYARVMHAGFAVKGVAGDGERERDVVIEAIEHAGSAIDYLRDAKQGVKDGFGEDDDIYQRYLEMAGEQE